MLSPFRWNAIIFLMEDPLKKGMEKFKEALDNPMPKPKPQHPTTFLMTLLLLLLLLFFYFFYLFIFNGEHFQQLIGTAMGTRVASTFACFFMGWLETMILATWMGTHLHLCLWRRYIDVIFFLWYGREEKPCISCILVLSIHTAWVQKIWRIFCPKNKHRIKCKL